MTRADKEEVDRRISLYTQNDVSRRAAARRKAGIRETFSDAKAALHEAFDGSRARAREHLITLAAIVCRLIEEHEDFRE